MQLLERSFERIVMITVRGSVNAAEFEGILVPARRAAQLPPTERPHLVLDLTAAEFTAEALPKLRSFLQTRKNTLSRLLVASPKIASADAANLDAALATIRTPEAEAIRELLKLDWLHPRLALESANLDREIAALPDFTDECRKLKADLIEMSAARERLLELNRLLAAESPGEPRWDPAQRDALHAAEASLLAALKGAPVPS